MAKQMQYSLPVPYQTTPQVFPASYWVPVVKELNKVNKYAVVEFVGYADKAARDAAIAPVARTGMTISGLNYDKYIAPALEDNGPNLLKQLYMFATEVPMPNRNHGPRRDDREQVPVFFFANATDV